MNDLKSWVEQRLAAAMEAATTGAHVFPDAVSEEFAKLLAGQLQEARKPAELDAIAAALIAANRGEQ